MGKKARGKSDKALRTNKNDYEPFLFTIHKDSCSRTKYKYKHNKPRNKSNEV